MSTSQPVQGVAANAAQAEPTFSAFAVDPAIASAGVLLVDDCSIQRLIVLDQLREAGVARLFEATDGESALELLRGLDAPPAIMVLDLNMPRMDGFETMRQLAAFSTRPALVILSGSDASLLDSMAALAEELKLQYLGAVAKPLDLGNLQRAFARYRPEAPRRAAPSAPAQDEVTVELLDVALQSEWIVAHYQPKIDLRSGAVVGLEALARWRRPDGSMVWPSQFIGVAEREGRVDALTLRMVDVVLADLQRWKEQGFAPSVSINVSSHSLSQRELTDEIVERVEVSGISPKQIIVEITESALAGNIAVALGCIGRLRMHGFGLSIDDYGTGFSSLQQLARMPFTELKIDRAFVRNAKENPRQRTILGSAIDIGQRLKLHTVAEGIETIEDLEVLVAMGCEQGQGYLLAKPMDPAALLSWRDESAVRIAQLCREAAGA